MINSMEAQEVYLDLWPRLKQFISCYRLRELEFHVKEIYANRVDEMDMYSIPQMSIVQLIK
jgi:hypothetical protein